MNKRALLLAVVRNVMTKRANYSPYPELDLYEYRSMKLRGMSLAAILAIAASRRNPGSLAALAAASRAAVYASAPTPAKTQPAKGRDAAAAAPATDSDQGDASSDGKDAVVTLMAAAGGIMGLLGGGVVSGKQPGRAQLQLPPMQEQEQVNPYVQHIIEDIAKAHRATAHIPVVKHIPRYSSPTGVGIRLRNNARARHLALYNWRRQGGYQGQHNALAGRTHQPAKYLFGRLDHLV